MALTNVAGGWTVDQGYIDLINDNNLEPNLFRLAIEKAIQAKLTAIEGAGTLTPAERALADSGGQGTDRALEFVKLEPKYTARGHNCPYADVVTMVNNQWANILKRWE
jgi:hypothetical protein